MPNHRRKWRDIPKAGKLPTPQDPNGGPPIPKLIASGLLAAVLFWLAYLLVKQWGVS